MVSTIAIAGISSKLALRIAEELLKQADVQLRGSCRDPSKLPEWIRSSSRISFIETGPYDKDPLRSLVERCEVVICCYLADNETMREAQKILIDICEAQGVARYIASDYTADFTKLEYGDVIIKDPMKDIKAYLETKSTTKGVHVLIGLFVDTFWDLFGYWNPEQYTLSYWGSGKEKWEFTTMRTTAQYVAALALDETAIGMYKFLGDSKSTIEIAEDVQSVYGLKPQLTKLGSLEYLKKRVDDSGDQQNPLEAGTYYMLSGRWPVSDELNNNRYPNIKPETLVDFLTNRSRAS